VANNCSQNTKLIIVVNFYLQEGTRLFRKMYILNNKNNNTLYLNISSVQGLHIDKKFYMCVTGSMNMQYSVLTMLCLHAHKHYIALNNL